MIKIMKHEIEMTAAAEMQLVRKAKDGDRIAEKMLLEAYIEPVMDAHKFSAIGEHPSKLGYSRNYYGYSFEEYGEPIAEIHHRCIQLFDFEKKHKTAPLPYLKYLLDTIGHRAMDTLQKEQRQRSMEVPESKLKAECQSSQGDAPTEQDDFMDAIADKGMMPNNSAQERKDAEMKKLCQKVMGHKDLLPGHREFMSLYLKKAREKASHKRLMDEIAKEMTGDETKRGNVYHYQNTAKDPLPAKLEDQFREVLGITGE